MKEIYFDLGRTMIPIAVPDYADILTMAGAPVLKNPQQDILQALAMPIGSPSLETIVRQKLISHPQAKAAVVISDSTRPVPYTGEETGILVPLIEKLKQAGLKTNQICLLIATGSHHPLREDDIRRLLDPRIFDMGLTIVNHDCRSRQDMVPIGRTPALGEIYINRLYRECEIKILTGLVESHFMAGASGGRKSICPGLLAEENIFALHGAQLLSSPQAADLVLEGNPVHEEALRVAKMAGCDFILNVVLDTAYQLTGVFAGDLEAAHGAAVKLLQRMAAIPCDKQYDLVLTHAGFVGINHYQAAKGGLICLPVVKTNGVCVLAAQHSDLDPIGSPNYKKIMRLLGKLGPDRFMAKILAPNWTLVPDQWEAQMWSRLFKVVPPENFLYCTLDISPADFAWLPGTDARTILPEPDNLGELANAALRWAEVNLSRKLRRKPNIAVLPGGPYGIPVRKG